MNNDFFPPTQSSSTEHQELENPMLHRSFRDSSSNVAGRLFRQSLGKTTKDQGDGSSRATEMRRTPVSTTNDRIYKCGWNDCDKAYHTLNHLNAHITMQAHGQKRTPEQFKEIRKEWKARKKEEAQRMAEEERQHQGAIAQNTANTSEEQPGAGSFPYMLHHTDANQGILTTREEDGPNDGLPFLADAPQTRFIVSQNTGSSKSPRLNRFSDHLPTEGEEFSIQQSNSPPLSTFQGSSLLSEQDAYKSHTQHASTNITSMENQSKPGNRAQGLVTGGLEMEDQVQGGSEVEPQGQYSADDFDVTTVYSVESASDEPILFYINAVADIIVKDIQSRSNILSHSEVTSEYLDKILKRFAWKLHEEASNPFQWETSVTVHRMRKEIIARLGYHMNHDEVGTFISADQTEDEPPNRPRPSGMSAEFICKWLNSIEDSTEREEFDQTAGDTPDFINPSQLYQYNKFIIESEAYQWFVSELHQNSLLSFTDADGMSNLGSNVRKGLQAQNHLSKMSRRGPSEVKMMYQVDWDVIQFFHNEGFEPPFTDALEEFICLTGSWNEAQATTIPAYMYQTWPKSSVPIMNLLRELISQPKGQTCSYHQPNHVPFAGAGDPMLTAKIVSSSGCLISATGSPYFVSEIAEQLGWLASAAQLCPKKDEVVACIPYVTDIHISKENSGTRLIPVKAFCHIKLNFEEQSKTGGSIPGFCWGPLVFGRTLVRGYPILRRTEPHTGLELPLPAMAHLIRSQQVVQWKNKIMMKGFSSLLVATLVAANVVVWHLFTNGNSDERVSYSDPRLEALELKIPDSFSLRMLEQSRHTIGWCSKVIDLCGHSKSNYAIKPCALKKHLLDGTINRLNISPGFSGNPRNQPWRLSRSKDYPSLLNWITNQPIVFYDTLDNRGWLVDGASALLHLLRTSLHHDSNNPNSVYEWVFDATQLNEKGDEFWGRRAACKVLSDWNNMNLNLYVCNKVVQEDLILETKYSKLGDRIEELLLNMEMIIDWNKNSSIKNTGLSGALGSSKNIIGFDILEISKLNRQLCPRIKQTNLYGDGWIDLVQSTGIATIFGSGFGDLILPEEPNSSCSCWNSVPHGKNYMATSVSTLEILHQEYFQEIDPEIGTNELASMFSWLALSEPFKPCRCFKGKSIGNEDHDDPVHYLISKSSKKEHVRPGLTPVDLSALVKEGAVIFGHMETSPYSIDNCCANHETTSTSTLQDSRRDTQDSFVMSSTKTPSLSTNNITIPSLGSLNGEQGKGDICLKDEHNKQENVDEELQTNEEKKKAQDISVRKNRLQKATSMVSQLFKSRNT